VFKALPSSDYIYDERRNSAKLRSVISCRLGSPNTHPISAANNDDVAHNNVVLVADDDDDVA